MTGRQHNAWLRDFDRLRARLVEAQEERSQRQKMVPGPDGYSELEWVAYEREVMHEETNRLRAQHGVGPVSLEQIMRAERLACGHVDYTQKYALGCAELVPPAAAA